METAVVATSWAHGSLQLFSERAQWSQPLGEGGQLWPGKVVLPLPRARPPHGLKEAKDSGAGGMRGFCPRSVPALCVARGACCLWEQPWYSADICTMAMQILLTCTRPARWSIGECSLDQLTRTAFPPSPALRRIVLVLPV